VCSVRLAADVVSIQEYNTKSSTNASGIDIQEVAASTVRAETLRQADAALGEVIANTILTAPGKPVKRHLGQPLPDCERTGVDMSFRVRVASQPDIQCWRLPRNVGKSLSILSLFAHLPYDSLPVNPERDVKRVLSRFRLLGEQEVLADTRCFGPLLTKM